MILLIPAMTNKDSMHYMETICQKLAIKCKSLSIGLADIDDKTDPVKLKKLIDQLMKKGMPYSLLVHDKIVIKIIKTICDIFILAEKKEFRWSFGKQKRFNYSVYLISILGGKIKNTRSRFSKIMKMPLGKFYIQVRDSYIFEWMSMHYSIATIAEMAQFGESSSFSNYFKALTGKYPSDYRMTK